MTDSPDSKPTERPSLLNDIKQRNQKSTQYLVVAAIIAGILAIMFFRCYTA